MPPSTKRSLRTRSDVREEARSSPDPQDDSSPFPPTKRRRKNLEPTQEPNDDDESSVVADSSVANVATDDQLLAQVTQHLMGPKEYTTQASKDHANAIHEANSDGVKAYAKIAAQDWTFYVRKLTVNIGRASEPSNESSNDSDVVHIDLGPSKMVSRNHALIQYEDETWMLTVRGRNGLKIDGVSFKLGAQVALSSGKVIDIAGAEMMFVLPSEISPLHVHEEYLQRAGIAFPSVATPLRPNGVSVAGSAEAAGPTTSQGTSRALYWQPIASAPPNYKRPGTPPSSKGRSAQSQLKSPQGTGPGTMLISPDGATMMAGSDGGVDFSLDENRQCKPNYSYAQMITQAIMTAPDEKLNLNGIYTFIMKRYSYYRHQPANGWQNSIRHNLSLNKSFDKVARSTDEPGKGMKWQIIPEAREDMLRTAYKSGRGGHRGSSAPSSPASRQLSYITQGPKDLALKEPGSARKRKMSPLESPPLGSAKSETTPDRKHTGDRLGSIPDSSPVTRRSRANMPIAPMFTEPRAPQSPTLSTSYSLDDRESFVTPAPHRVHPKLVPPSTSQRPSQHMPTSSPAPFWKHADIGSTPLKPGPFDLSPSKPVIEAPQGSSPQAKAKHTSPGPSPSRTDRQERKDDPGITVGEEKGIDLTKGFQSIGSYHSSAGRLSLASAKNNG